VERLQTPTENIPVAVIQKYIQSPTCEKDKYIVKMFVIDYVFNEKYNFSEKTFSKTEIKGSFT